MLSSISSNKPTNIERILNVENPLDSPIQLPVGTASWLFRQTGSHQNGRLKRKLEFQAGRFCADQCLQDLEVVGEVGQAADRSPVWPTGVIGSISHSDQWVWAVARMQDDISSIGIDTEPVADAITLQHLSGEILTESENELGAKLDLSPAEVFTITFSAKESFYKCIYPMNPVFFGFLDVQVVRFDGSNVELVISENCPNQFFSGRTLKVSYVVRDNNVYTACWLNDKEVH